MALALTLLVCGCRADAEKSGSAEAPAAVQVGPENVVTVARATGAPVVVIHELSLWLGKKGLQNVKGMSIGGTVSVAGLEVTMTPAIHSSSVLENDAIVYLGEPAGFVVRFEDGRAIYFAGDTALFGDMPLIREMHKPDIAFLPIGDHYTMGPAAAARACQLLGVRQVVPMHYGTFPILTGTPEQLKALVTASQATWRLRKELDKSFLPSAALEKAYLGRMEKDKERFFRS